MIRTLQAIPLGSDPYSNSIMIIYIVFGFIYLLIAAIPSVAQYILTSIGLQRLASKHGVPRAGLSWLPIGNMYVLGFLADMAAEHNNADRLGYRKRLVGLSIPIVAITAVVITSLLTLLSWALILATLGIFHETFLGTIAAILLVVCYGALIPLLILGIKRIVSMYKGLWQIYRMYTKKLAILNLLLSIFVPFSIGIIMITLVDQAPTEPELPMENEPIDPTIFHS